MSSSCSPRPMPCTGRRSMIGRPRSNSISTLAARARATSASVNRIAGGGMVALRVGRRASARRCEPRDTDAQRGSLGLSDIRLLWIEPGRNSPVGRRRRTRPSAPDSAAAYVPGWNSAGRTRSRSRGVVRVFPSVRP
jgi:hypothetical protein